MIIFRLIFDFIHELKLHSLLDCIMLRDCFFFFDSTCSLDRQFSSSCVRCTFFGNYFLDEINKQTSCNVNNVNRSVGIEENPACTWIEQFSFFVSCTYSIFQAFRGISAFRSLLIAEALKFSMIECWFPCGFIRFEFILALAQWFDIVIIERNFAESSQPN